MTYAPFVRHFCHVTTKAIMGCCESCSYTHSQSLRRTLPPVKLIASLGQDSAHELLKMDSNSGKSSTAGSAGEKSPKQTPTDQKSTEIEAFVTEILEKGEWHVHISTDLCTVKSLLSPTRAPHEVPIFLLEVDFEHVDLEVVWKALYDADVRKMWDKSVVELEVAQVGGNWWTVHSVTKMPFPFKHRDFSERRTFTEYPDVLTTTHYSIPEQEGGSPVIEKYERAEEFFSSARVERCEGRTRLLLISQYDLKLPVAPAHMVSAAATQLQNWARELKREVLQLDNQS